MLLCACTFLCVVCARARVHLRVFALHACTRMCAQVRVCRCQCICSHFVCVRSCMCIIMHSQTYTHKNIHRHSHLLAVPPGLPLTPIPTPPSRERHTRNDIITKCQLRYENPLLEDSSRRPSARGKSPWRESSRLKQQYISDVFEFLSWG